jgi:diguanylate cyclase (GGDEF)-like protein
LINTLLSSTKLPDGLELDRELSCNPDFQKLLRYITDLRDLSSALSRGELQMFAYSKGFILSNMKALQANLRHLTWQTKQVADGDFSQRVEFLGDFSDAFNEMTAKLQENTLELERLANVDFLTQIPNRRSAMQYIEQIFMLYKRNRRPFSIMILDIDHFKHVNDTYGHDVGDKALKDISHTLKDVFRGSDMFCRLGGEEFIAILPETTLEGAISIAERCRRILEKTPVGLDDGTVLRCTVSVGVSQALPDDEKYNDIIVRSDNALYVSKETGRNRTCTMPACDVEKVLSSAQQMDNRRRRWNDANGSASSL